MNAGRTAFDPIFWGHHANVDRLWTEWRNSTPRPGLTIPNTFSPLADDRRQPSHHRSRLRYTMSSHQFPATIRSRSPGLSPPPAQVPAEVTHSHRRAEVRIRSPVCDAGRFLHPDVSEPGQCHRRHSHQGQSALCRMLNMFTAYASEDRALCVPSPGPRRSSIIGLASAPRISASTPRRPSSDLEELARRTSRDPGRPQPWIALPPLTHCTSTA